VGTHTTGTPLQTTTSIQAEPLTARLPVTGSGSLFPAIFGGSCLLGGALLALRHRRTIWSMRK
jgi:LPXTG-motif cell wall-anchored protein